VNGPPADDRFAQRLRGHGPVGVLVTLLVLAASMVLGPLKAVPVLLWAGWSRTPWRELGLVRPASWVRTAAVSAVLGVAFKLAMKSVVMPLLGADPINRTYEYLAHNPAALPLVLLQIFVGAAFGEEVVFRGYLFERWRGLFGNGWPARVAIVILTSVLFSAAHYSDQGVAGAQQALITGLTFGAVFAVTGRLAGVMIAHAAFDLAAIALIFWGLETRVAHWFFR
jgi:membrane protease YdiL (CAAX protease family)